MTGFRDVLVVSDLDGTLLDHETYSWDAARPALDVLRSGGAGLVLASSKTAAEISDLRDAIQFPVWPSIVENGSGLLEPGEDPQADLGGETSLYQTLRSAIAGLPAGFRGFGDMTEKEVSERTGLTLSAAQKARMRRFSEPGVWEADSAGLDAFLAAAQKASLTVQRGGRFTTLSFGGTKADKVVELVDRFKPRHTIVLGDAPNDVEMLRQADHGVIVANPSSAELPPLPGEDQGRIRRTTRPGPEGWADAVLDILQAISQMKETGTHG
ncbi:MAG: HAD hydrolase family protein [Pseudomonadota bacterium]